MTNKPNGVLYVGVTNNLIGRVHEHKQGLADGFTKKYHLKKLVYFEETNQINEAIEREKRLKKWKRDWKINLITEFNSDWLDLYSDIAE